MFLRVRQIQKFIHLCINIYLRFPKHTKFILNVSIFSLEYLLDDSNINDKQNEKNQKCYE